MTWLLNQTTIYGGGSFALVLYIKTCRNIHEYWKKRHTNIIV